MKNRLAPPPIEKDALSLLEYWNELEQNGIKSEGTPKIFVFQDAITKC
jgi:hypothetical protein